jgi:prepilin-type N-terminal cleavage/methylation domain-containing protein
MVDRDSREDQMTGSKQPLCSSLGSALDSRRYYGFTLIELLMVIAISATLAIGTTSLRLDVPAQSLNTVVLR